jgi:Uncharacterised nucleotidyltransferase
LTVSGLHALLGAQVETIRGDRQDLIALLSALEDPPRAAQLPSDDRLIAVARHHRISPLLSITVGSLLPSRLAEAFRRDRLITAARNLALGHVAGGCIRALAVDGIPAIVLKGLAYEQSIYRTGETRPTSDIDLLVPNESRRAAFQVLERLGFEPRACAPGFDDPDYHEVAWTRSDAEVDLHLALVPFVRCRIDYKELWAGAQPLNLGQAQALALSPVHAAVFHALHMAVDHFGVPAIYLVDLSRLISMAGDLSVVAAPARAWRCYRPLATALALTAAFLPAWAARHPAVARAAAAPRVVEQYGQVAPLARPEQLLRKLIHFDTFADATRYVTVQSRRNIRETIERYILKRSPRERLNMPRAERRS